MQDQQEEWSVDRSLVLELLGQTDPVSTKRPFSIDIHS